MKIMRDKINVLLSCLVAMAVWSFTACDETMGGDSTLGFPANTIVAEKFPGDTVLISFNVGYNWRLTSDKDWCRVDGDYRTTSGKPGEHDVVFVIGEPENLFAADEALITMRMNDEERVVARITCLATMEYAVEVSSDDRVYADGESIVIDASGELNLNLASNFNIEKLGTKFPTWLEMQRVDMLMTLRVKADSLKYIFNNDCDSLLLFKDSTYRSSYHVQYVGMEPRTVRIDGQQENPLVVSRDAKRVYVNSVEGARKEMPISFTVAALNDDYQVVPLSYDNINGYSILEEKWFELTDDGCGNLTLSVTKENEGKDRNVTLLAFPKIIADSLANIGIGGLVDFLYENVDGATTLKADAKQYLLVQMSQYGLTNITIDPEARWGLKVAVDGKTYTTSTLTDTLDAPLTATITTDNGYQLVHVSYDNEVGCVIIPETDSWMNVTDDGYGNIEVTFERNQGNMRTAYLLALPTVIAEDKENLASELFAVAEGHEEGPLEIRDDAVKYVVAQFIQEAEEESSLKVIDANFGWKYLTIANETEEKWLKVAGAKGIGPKKVFRAELKTGVSYLLNPLLAEEVWNPGEETSNDRIEVYGESGVKYTQGKTDGCHYEAEPTKMEEEEGEYMLVQFKARYEVEEDYYIIYFVTADDVYLKALVVYNYWE